MGYYHTHTLRDKAWTDGLLCAVIGFATFASFVGCGDSSSPGLPPPSTHQVSLESDRSIKTERAKSNPTTPAKVENSDAQAQNQVVEADEETPKTAAAPEKSDPAQNDPPFLVREHPFSPPDREATSLNQAGGEGSQSEVSLKGFANVSGIRAVLVIDGEMRTLEVGQEYRNVRVMAIQPPEVTLRRGRDVWKETLRKPIADKT